MKNYNFLVSSVIVLFLSFLIITLKMDEDQMVWILLPMVCASVALFFATKFGAEKGKIEGEREGKKEWYGRPMHTGDLPEKVYPLVGDVLLKNNESCFVLHDENRRKIVAYGSSTGGNFVRTAGFFAPRTLVPDQRETAQAPSSLATTSG